MPLLRHGLAAAGHSDRAGQLVTAVERLACTITDSSQQAEVLVELAVALAEDGSVPAPRRSRAVISTLLVGSSWFMAMPVLATLAPAAVAAVGGAMLDALITSERPSQR